MRARRGFTVLELTVALTLTAVALALTGTALSAARSTEAAIARSRQTALPSAQARVLLTDLLRHLPRPEEVEVPLLSLTPGPTGPTLQFLSRGLDAPHGTGPIWSIRLAQTGDSLRLEATPLRATGHPMPRRILVPRSAPLEIEALVATADGQVERYRDWSAPVQAPTALALRWERAVEGTPGAELVVTLDPLGRRP